MVRGALVASETHVKMGRDANHEVLGPPKASLRSQPYLESFLSVGRLLKVGQREASPLEGKLGLCLY